MTKAALSPQIASRRALQALADRVKPGRHGGRVADFKDKVIELETAMEGLTGKWRFTLLQQGLHLHWRLRRLLAELKGELLQRIIVLEAILMFRGWYGHYR